MTDSNLHVIIGDVRQSLETKDCTDPDGVFGTILSLKGNEMFRELWDQEFLIVIKMGTQANRCSFHIDLCST